MRALVAERADGDPRALYELASAHDYVGREAEAVALLEALPDDAHAPGRSAFLALALHDAGRPTEALAVALRRLAPTLPEYGRAVGAYAHELGERSKGAGER
jgi:hypothetical protein